MNSLSRTYHALSLHDSKKYDMLSPPLLERKGNEKGRG
jgi:hypothetical protein